MSITKYRCAILMYSVGGFSCFQSLITSMYGIVVPSKIKEKKKHSLIQPLPHSSPAASIYAENMELEMWWGHTAICWLEWLRLSLERLCPLEFPLVLSRLVFLSTVHKKRIQSWGGSMARKKTKDLCNIRLFNILNMCFHTFLATTPDV